MQVIRDAMNSADLPYSAVATIGNYDGIHRGQRAVIEQVVSHARESGTQSVVISFRPHPVAFLRPADAPPLLTAPHQREAQLEALGVDVLAEIRFNADVARMSAESFVRQFLHQRMAVQALYVGQSFTFGNERQGDVAVLERMGAELGFETVGVEELLESGQPVSATRIRQALQEGNASSARELLGRPYTLRGTIQRGDRMGMRLGWPTINLKPENDLIPAQGVYVGRARFPSFPATFDCVTNVGTRPTVYEHYQQVVESHVLGFSAEVYGETVELEFWKRLREEKLFPNVMELSAQIGRDVETAREFFAVQRRYDEGAEGNG